MPQKGGTGGVKVLLPSAVHLEERLTVSQSVSQSGQQSVRQSFGQAGRRTETHSLGFFSVADSAPSSGKNSHCQNKQRSNGNQYFAK